MARSGSQTAPATFGSEVEQEFRRLCSAAGIDKSWTIQVRRTALDDAYAQVACLPEDRIVILEVGAEAHTSLSPKEVAMHEFLHVLLWNLIGSAAALKNPRHSIVQGEEHAVIAALLSVMRE